MKRMRMTLVGLFIAVLVGAFFLVPAAPAADRAFTGQVGPLGSIFQSENGDEYYINQSSAGIELIKDHRGQKVKVQADVERPGEGEWPNITIKSYEVIQE